MSWQWLAIFAKSWQWLTILIQSVDLFAVWIMSGQRLAIFAKAEPGRAVRIQSINRFATRWCATAWRWWLLLSTSDAAIRDQIICFGRIAGVHFDFGGAAGS